jgi:hypothetical protein
MARPNRRSLFRGFVAVTSLIFLSLLTTTRLGSRQVTADPGASSRKDAVALLRIVNTSESRYRTASGAYADWKQLTDSRIPQTLMEAARQNMQKMTPPPEPSALGDLGSAQPLPGYTLALYTSSDRAHYIALLRPDSNTGPCVESLYTSDDGLIRSAKTIDCR